MFFIIYETVNIINGKKYRGCHITEELNDGYLGSGVLFKKALKKYGKENFKRSILAFCENTENMIEKEAEYVDETWVSRKDTYNLQTGGLSYGILSEESKIKLSKSVSDAHRKGKYDYKKLKGKKPWNFEKKNVYSYDTIEKMKNAKSDFTPWNKNKKGYQKAWNKGMTTGKMKEEHKNKISNSLKEKYSTQEHHLKGKDPWNKGLKTGKKSWNSGLKIEKNITCPHCGKLGASIANMKRWHFDNCKKIKT